MFVSCCIRSLLIALHSVIPCRGSWDLRGKTRPNALPATTILKFKLTTHSVRVGRVLTVSNGCSPCVALGVSA